MFIFTIPYCIVIIRQCAQSQVYQHIDFAYCGQLRPHHINNVLLHNLQLNITMYNKYAQPASGFGDRLAPERRDFLICVRFRKLRERNLMVYTKVTFTLPWIFRYTRRCNCELHVERNVQSWMGGNNFISQSILIHFFVTV